MKRFNADKITVTNFEGMSKYRKKPLDVHAVQMNFPEGFKVTSKEGIVKGQKGDYLIIGKAGEKYMCPKDSFDQEYEIIEEDVPAGASPHPEYPLPPKERAKRSRE